MVVGVEVKETSQGSACWRFLRNPNEINIPSDGRPFQARLRLNVKRSANGSRRRFCASAARPFVTVHAARIGRKICWPAYEEWAGPAPPRQAARSARPAPPACGLDWMSPARRRLPTQVREVGSDKLQSRPGRRPRRRPFFWPKSGARLQPWLAPANPEHGRPRRRTGCPTTSTTMRARRPVAWAVRLRAELLALCRCRPRAPCPQDSLQQAGILATSPDD